MDSLKLLLCFYPRFVKYNYGIALLSALCKKRGIEVDMHMFGRVQDFFTQLRDKRYDYIGFSVTSRKEYPKILPFAKLARDTGHKTLLGGTWLNLMHPVDEDVFDGVCRGEGETLPDFLLSWDTKLFKSPMIHTDLNTLPIPDYELFENIPFKRGVPVLDDQKVLPYMSSRGCPHKCMFCQAQHQPFHRIRTKVFRDLEEITGRYKPEALFMLDTILPYDSTRWRGSWMDFRYPFVAYIRASIKPDILLWLIDRGLKGCAFGIESGDEQYRNDVLKKDLSDDEIWRTIGILNKHNVPYSTYWMRNTPGEKMIHQMKTEQMMRKMEGYTCLASYEELLWQSEQ